MTKPPVARKLAVGHLRVRQLVIWLLVVSSFNYFQMHTWSTGMLLLLHSTFMLSVVKLLRKGEVGVFALNNHGNYTVDHAKSWKKSWNCVFLISVGTLNYSCNLKWLVIHFYMGECTIGIQLY